MKKRIKSVVKRFIHVRPSEKVRQKNISIQNQVLIVTNLAFNIKQLESLVKLLANMDDRLFSNRLVQLTFIDRFTSFGWEESTVQSLSSKVLGKFLRVSNISSQELEPYFQRIFLVLSRYSKSDLSDKDILEFDRFLNNSNAIFCSALSLFKSGSVGLNELWFGRFFELYCSKKTRDNQLKRRFISYMIYFHHLDGVELLSTENKVLDQALQSNLIDLGDILLLSQRNDHRDGGYTIPNTFNSLLSAHSDKVTKYSLVQANLMRSNSSDWVENTNRYLSIFDIALVASAEGGDFQSILFEDVQPAVDRGLVTIGMPAFNAESTIEASLRSLLNQNYNNLEIIVVDDLSTDRTCEIVEKIVKEDARVKLVRNDTNCGPYVSRNVALNLAKGRFFTINDADDLSHPERVSAHVDLLLERNVFAVESRMLRISNELTFISDTQGAFIRKNASSLFFETQAMLDEFGYWDTVRFGADTELFERLEKAGKSVVMSPKPYLLAKFGMQNLSVIKSNIFRGYTGSRKAYSIAFRRFHETVEDFSALKYGFFNQRSFSVPEEMTVSLDCVAATEALLNLKV